MSRTISSFRFDRRQTCVLECHYKTLDFIDLSTEQAFLWRLIQMKFLLRVFISFAVQLMEFVLVEYKSIFTEEPMESLFSALR